MALVIISQLKQEEKPVYWKVLDSLFDALPYPLAKQIIDANKHFFQLYSKPNILQKICMSAIRGAQFETSATLSIANFFDVLADGDPVQSDIWTGISKEFEEIATNRMETIESNHLLFLLLTVPVATHNGKSLVQVALEER
eukprot:46411_1